MLYILKYYDESLFLDFFTDLLYLGGETDSGDKYGEVPFCVVLYLQCYTSKILYLKLFFHPPWRQR